MDYIEKDNVSLNLNIFDESEINNNKNIDKKENEDNKIELLNINFNESKNNNKEINVVENNNIKNDYNNESIINTNNEIHEEVKDNNENEVENIIINEEENEIKLDFTFVNNNIKLILNKNESNNHTITIKKLEKKYYRDHVTGDGNCLFYSLSNLIFGNSNYYHTIRQLVCDYIENKIETKELFDGEVEKNNYLSRMRNDKTFGTGTEAQVFSIICGIKIMYYLRIINSSKCLKNKNDQVKEIIINEKGIGNFGLLLDIYKNHENINHYSSLRYKKGNGISNENLIKIKKIICGIDPKSNDEIDFSKFEIKNVISGKTGKVIGSRQGKSEWKLFTVYSRIKRLKYSNNYYKVIQNNEKLDIKKKVNYNNIIECIKLSNLLEHFNSDNIKKNGVGYIINNYENIIIDKINEKDKINDFKTKDLMHTLNLTDELCKVFTKCICYYCSGINDNNKNLFKIYRSLYELKNHCRDYHNGNIKDCIINYTLTNDYVEIEPQKDRRFIMSLEDMLEIDRNDILVNQIGGGYRISNYFNVDNLKIKIFGENILTLNETNRALISNKLDEYRPDFMLLNECKIGKAKFNIKGYKLELSNKQEVGIIYKDIYYLNNCFTNIEDDYNLIRMANTKGGNFILFCTYLPPNEEHNYRLQELIQKLKILRYKYNNLTLILFGDLNMNRDVIENKLSKEIEILGFKIWYNRNKNEYTREQKVNDNNKKSYLDYMITYGIDNLCFNILDKLVITDHRALSIEFLEDKKRKLDRVKEIIEPYNIANNKIDDISNKLIDVFKSEVPEVKLLRLLHDNKFNFKTRRRKFKFRSNQIKKIVEVIKEMEKKGDIYGLRKLIHRHKTENWHIFLKNLQELRIKNNVKEYFLRLRFYTYINRNTDVLKNLKIINNDKIKITLNKKEINEEIIKKYKDLLGDKGYKEYYFDINDKVINITTEDIIYGCKNVVRNKATSWDLIPGKSIKKALKKIEDLEPVYEKLKIILNRYLIPGVIPEEITTSRLFCLNKKADEVGDINNIRPIAIFFKIN